MLTDVQKKKLEEFCEVCGREDWAYVGPARKPDSCMIRFAWCSPKNAAEHWRLGYEHMKKAAVPMREALETCRGELRNYVRTELGDTMGSVVEAIQEADAALALADALEAK